MHFGEGIVTRDVFFTDNATFQQGAAGFGNARVGGNAGFIGAVFEQQVNFNGAQIAQNAYFDSATFKGDADF